MAAAPRKEPGRENVIVKRIALRIAALGLATACGAPLADEPPSAPRGPDRKAAPAPPVPEAPVAPEEAAGLWRAARWGMTVDEVLKAFPGEATRLEKPLELADGNVVAAGIDAHAVAGHPLRVRFVFEGGKLAIVSLRTPELTKASGKIYEELQRHLRGRMGQADYDVKEEPFVEQRQTRWTRARGIVDLKSVPGTVVVMYSAPPAVAPAAGK